MGKRRSSFVASDNSDDERPAKISKTKTASSSNNSATVDSEGNAFWELSNKRRVVVQKFSGKIFVNIREFYEDKAGDMKPGKKGIMLSVEQYQSLAGLIPSINKELRKQGVDIDGSDDGDKDDKEDTEEGPVKPSKSSKSKSKGESKKANIEATSDEDEE